MTLGDTKSMGIADVLDRAADLIEPEGAWIQGDFEAYRAGQLCFCALGAIIKCARPGQWLDAREAVYHVLPENTLLTPWNDKPSRTQPEVVAKLREAAAKARAEGK